MEYHLSIAGERSGPHTQFHIIEGIRDERLKGDELLWHVGLQDWQPLRTVREFEGFWPVSEETRLRPRRHAKSPVLNSTVRGRGFASGRALSTTRGTRWRFASR